MRNRSLVDICSVIRDLTAREKNTRLNRSDQDIMNRAQSLLIDEWQLSLGGERQDIERELYALLHKE